MARTLLSLPYFLKVFVVCLPYTIDRRHSAQNQWVKLDVIDYPNLGSTQKLPLSLWLKLETTDLDAFSCQIYKFLKLSLKTFVFRRRQTLPLSGKTFNECTFKWRHQLGCSPPSVSTGQLLGWLNVELTGRNRAWWLRRLTPLYPYLHCHDHALRTNTGGRTHANMENLDIYRDP